LDEPLPGFLANVIVLNEYDAYGNLVFVIDPRGYLTRSVFDSSNFFLYPTQEIRPPTNGGTTVHVMEIVTDLRYGKPLQVKVDRNLDGTDEVTSYQYDSLGRLTRKDFTPSGCAGSAFPSLEQYDYFFASETASTFEGMLTRVEARTCEPNAPGGYLTTQALSDGLGRARLAKTQQVIGGSSILETVVREQREYDAAGRPTRLFAPYVAAQGNAFPNPAGSGIAFTATSYLLNGGSVPDPLGRPHQVTPPDGHPTTTYHEGRQTRTLNPAGGEIVVLRDHLGREIKRTLKDNGVAEMWFDYTVDGLGRAIATQTSGDPATNVTVVYDTLGRKIQVDDPDSGLWSYGYDAGGNLIYQDDPKAGQHVEFAYDEHNRIQRRCILSQDGYESGIQPCDYGPGFESSYTYDSTGSGNFGLGQVALVADLSGSETFAYDDRGRVIVNSKTIQGVTAEMTFAYDGAGHLLQMTYPGDPQHEVVSYGYNLAGQATSVTSDTFADDYLVAAQYDLFGRPLRLAHGNGRDDAFQYYGAPESFRLSRITSGPPAAQGASAFLDVSYDYNDLGKISGVTDHRNSSGSLSNQATYGYDGLGRLSSVSGPALTGSYGFDEFGNLALKEDQAIEYAGLPHQATEHAGVSLAYDANGNRTAKGDLDPVTHEVLDGESSVYDKLGRLVTAKVGPAASPDYTIAYLYDYASRRVRKTVNGGLPVLYFNDYLEYQDGQVQKYYFLGNRRLAARVDDAELTALLFGGYRLGRKLDWGPLVQGGALVLLGSALLLLLVRSGRSPVRVGVAVSSSRALGSSLLVVVALVPSVFLFPRSAAAWCTPAGYLWHYHLDHLGSTQVTSEANGALLQQVRYRPYGEVRGRFNSAGNPVGLGELYRREFSAYESQQESELQYAGARFYDPTMGQFLSHDPAGQFASPYAYGPWDPINGNDPGGTDWILVAVLIGISIAISGLEALYAASGPNGSTSAALKAFGIGLATIAVTYGVLGPVSNFVSQALHPAVAFSLTAGPRSLRARASGEQPERVGPCKRRHRASNASL